MGCGDPPHLAVRLSLLLSLVEIKISEREVPVTIAQRVVIKFLTNENIGPNEIGVDYAHNTGNQQCRRRK